MLNTIERVLFPLSAFILVPNKVNCDQVICIPDLQERHTRFADAHLDSSLVTDKTTKTNGDN